MRQYFVIVLFAMWAGRPAFGQELMFHLGGQGAMPMGEFKEMAPEATGVGFNLGAMVGFEYESPFYIGLEGGYMLYGKSVENDVAEVTVRYDSDGDGVKESVETVSADLVANNNIVHTHLLLRWRPQWNFRIVPYVDAIGGLKYFYTRSKLRPDVPGGDLGVGFNTENRDTDTEHGSFAASYGGGAGIHIMFSENIGLDVGAQYLMGTRTDFITKQGVEYDVDKRDFVYQTVRSKTDLLMINLRFIFYFLN